MFSRIRMVSGMAAMIVMALALNVAALAGPVETAPATEAPVTESGTEIAAPAENPDARALSGDELATFNTMADSTSQNPDVQNMNVGATINTTIVLSVLLALVIFAVLVAVL